MSDTAADRYLTPRPSSWAVYITRCLALFATFHGSVKCSQTAHLGTTRPLSGCSLTPSRVRDPSPLPVLRGSNDSPTRCAPLVVGLRWEFSFQMTPGLAYRSFPIHHRPCESFPEWRPIDCHRVNVSPRVLVEKHPDWCYSPWERGV